jgi:hypothetical protein
LSGYIASLSAVLAAAVGDPVAFEVSVPVGVVEWTILLEVLRVRSV